MKREDHVVIRIMLYFGRVTAMTTIIGGTAAAFYKIILEVIKKNWAPIAWLQRITGSVLAVVLILPASVAGVPTGSRAGQPQVHVAKFGPYIVRANAIQSEVLPVSVARSNGIERAPDRGVLNLVILERKPDGRDVTVPAEVNVRQENLLGQSEAIKMRAIEENGSVSYLGTFGFASQRNFRFTIGARPVGSGKALTIKFEDRFSVRD